MMITLVAVIAAVPASLFPSDTWPAQIASAVYPSAYVMLAGESEKLRDSEIGVENGRRHGSASRHHGVEPSIENRWQSVGDLPVIAQVLSVDRGYVRVAADSGTGNQHTHVHDNPVREDTGHGDHEAQKEGRGSVSDLDEDGEGLDADAAHTESHDHAGPASDADADIHAAPADPAGSDAHSDPGLAHDHATGHGQPTGLWRLIRFLGKFHPLVVHFPIALVLATVAAEVLSAVSRKPVFAEAARFMIVLAGLSVVLTVGLGWAAGAFAEYTGDASRTLWLHRWLGTVSGILVVLTAVLSEVSRLKNQERPFRIWYRTSLFIAGVMIGLTGHFGATLIYGLDYFNW